MMYLPMGHQGPCFYVIIALRTVDAQVYLFLMVPPLSRHLEAVYIYGVAPYGASGLELRIYHLPQVGV